MCQKPLSRPLVRNALRKEIKSTYKKNSALKLAERLDQCLWMSTEEIRTLRTCTVSKSRWLVGSSSRRRWGALTGKKFEEMQTEEKIDEKKRWSTGKRDTHA
jgi:hypothetical protein